MDTPKTATLYGNAVRVIDDEGTRVLPNSFFTSESFLSLAGSAAIVFVVCSTVQTVFDFNPRWLGLAVAEVVAFFGTWASGNSHVPSDYFVSVLNGCLIFTTATGGNGLASAAKEAGRPRGAVSSEARRRGFLSPWF